MCGGNLSVAVGGRGERDQILGKPGYGQIIDNPGGAGVDNPQQEPGM